MSEENLADRVPQVSRRARAYNLEDNGASELSHRERAARDAVASRKRIIAAIEKRQAGDGRFAPMHPEVAAWLIAGHREAIRELQATGSVGPTVNVIAPVGRRVKREDRRRTHKTGKKS